MIIAQTCIMQQPSGNSLRSTTNLPTGRILKRTPNNGSIPGSTSLKRVTNVPAGSKSGERNRKWKKSLLTNIARSAGLPWKQESVANIGCVFCPGPNIIAAITAVRVPFFFLGRWRADGPNPLSCGQSGNLSWFADYAARYRDPFSFCRQIVRCGYNVAEKMQKAC